MSLLDYHPVFGPIREWNGTADDASTQQPGNCLGGMKVLDQNGIEIEGATIVCACCGNEGHATCEHCGTENDAETEEMNDG